MRRATIPSFLLIVAVGIASCTLDSSWLGLVGRWQDVESPAMEMEFTEGGQFSEYFYGELVGYGDFYAEGSTVTLHYSSPCGGENQGGCDVRLGFTVTENTLIITDAQGDFRFSKVGGSQ